MLPWFLGAPKTVKLEKAWTWTWNKHILNRSQIRRLPGPFSDQPKHPPKYARLPGSHARFGPFQMVMVEGIRGYHDGTVCFSRTKPVHVEDGATTDGAARSTVGGRGASEHDHLACWVSCMALQVLVREQHREPDCAGAHRVCCVDHSYCNCTVIFTRRMADSSSKRLA